MTEGFQTYFLVYFGLVLFYLGKCTCIYLNGSLTAENIGVFRR